MAEEMASAITVSLFPCAEVHFLHASAPLIFNVVSLMCVFLGIWQRGCHLPGY
jgi:hypothetical protein